MKNYKLLSLIALTAAFSCSPNNEDGQSGNTPVEKYGALKVSGIQLCAQNGKAVQLRGMSTHGLQWFGKCQTEEAYRSLAEEWQCDVVRLALYAEENGYNTDPLKFRNKIETLVGYCEKYGMYCIIDWHVLHPGDPNDPKYDTADDFFAWASKKFAGKPHVLYEICNVPNGDEVTWAVVKRYAERVIPIIRANSPNAVVICGTPKWSADFTDVVKDPLTYKNILYTYHFYAASLQLRQPAKLPRPSARIRDRMGHLRIQRFGEIRSGLLAAMDTNHGRRQSGQAESQLGDMELLGRRRHGGQSRSGQLHGMPVHQRQTALRPVHPGPDPGKKALSPRPELN